MAITKHFILGGALVNAYSRPVTLAKISEIAMKKYAGAWTATCIWLGSVSLASGQARGYS